MDENRIIGSAKKFEGKAKEIAGDFLGDEKLKAEGIAQAAIGTVQNFAGGVSDAARDLYDEAPESLKANIEKTVALIRANPAIASIAVATVGGLATWYATSNKKK
jgi:uncharacterized protein YjbJ (UPF0337 family)